MNEALVKKPEEWGGFEGHFEEESQLLALGSFSADFNGSTQEGKSSEVTELLLGCVTCTFVSP
jgi:hypothetical protein